MNATEMMFEQPARVGAMIWIPGAVADEEGLPEIFEEDFCEYLPEKEGHLLYSQLPDLAKFAGECPEPWEVADMLRNRSGFLLKAETPVKSFYPDGTSSYSWGYHRFTWLYAASEADIAGTVIAWAKSVDDGIRAKAEG